jgi:glucosylceramidase
MMHFSKYIRPEAQRIGVSSDLKNIMVTSCINSDGTIVAVILNQQDKSEVFALRLGDRNVSMTIDANAIQTVLIEQ